MGAAPDQDRPKLSFSCERTDGMGGGWLSLRGGVAAGEGRAR